MDSCRGLAAIAIVLAHAYGGSSRGHLVDLTTALASAVQVFFGLSGFLLMRPYLRALALGRPLPGFADFFQRRALRILPAYWVALTALALLLGPQYAPGALSSRWWVYYGFGQVYLLHGNYGGLAVAWSLSVEVAFYVCLPLIAAAIARVSRRLGWTRAVAVVLAPLFVLSPVVRLLNTLPLGPGAIQLVERITYALPGQFCFFAVGIALAVWSVQSELHGRSPRALRALIDRPVLAWLLAAICFALVATVGGYNAPVAVPYIGQLAFRARFLGDQLLVCAFVALALIPAAFESRSPRLPQRVLAWRPLVYAGLISYGLYLWHAPLAKWLNAHTALHHVYTHWPEAVRWPVGFAVILAAGLIAGSVSYYVVELPFLRRKRGWRRQEPSYDPTAATGLVGEARAGSGRA